MRRRPSCWHPARPVAKSLATVTTASPRCGHGGEGVPHGVGALVRQGGPPRHVPHAPAAGVAGARAGGRGGQDADAVRAQPAGAVVQEHADEAGVVGEAHVRHARRTQGEGVVGAGMLRRHGRALTTGGAMAPSVVALRRTKAAGGDAQGREDLGPHGVFPRPTGDAFDRGAQQHVVGVAVGEGPALSAGRPAQRPGGDDGALFREARGIVPGGHQPLAADDVVVEQTPSVMHQVVECHAVPSGVEGHTRKGLGQRHAPSGAALLHQPGEQGGGHGLGVRAQAPAVVEGDRFGAALLPQAAHRRPLHAGLADDHGAHGRRRVGGEDGVEGGVGRLLGESGQGRQRRQDGEAGQHGAAGGGHRHGS